MMFLEQGQTIQYWHPNPSQPLSLALKDLTDDFQRVLSAPLVPCPQPADADIILINLQKTPWPGLSIKPGQWERYQIAVTNQQIIIAGADERGLLFAIYQFCQHALGVDPLWFWIPQHPAPRQRIHPADAVHTSPAPTFKYRGWFINGEDLLEEWHYGDYRQAQDWYGIRHKAISYQTYDRLFETMLRLRVNLIIPATVMDIMEPETEAVFQQIRNRGLLFSQHHIEPVGVGPSHSFVNFHRRDNRTELYSWTNNRAVVENCWRKYIDRIADYGPHVVWQLGYRGAGDVPFWRTEPNAPADMPGRAAVISSAISRQYQLIRQRVGSHAEIPCTATLWWEGNVLHRKGLLRLPEEAIVVISDVARTQMLPRTLRTQEPGRRFGVYYHTSYWSTGPHLIQGNPPANVFANYDAAIDARAHTYSMHHVSNFRPFLPIIQGVAHFTFNRSEFDPSSYMRQFCQNHFGPHDIENLYQQHFDAFVHRDEPDLQDQNARWLDGALGLFVRNVILTLDAYPQPNDASFAYFMRGAAFRLQLLRTNAPIHELAGDEYICNNWKGLAKYVCPQLTASLQRWDELIKQTRDVRSRLSIGSTLLDSNLLWQSILARGLTLAALHSLSAMDAWAGNDKTHAAELLASASAALDAVLMQGPALAEQHHFKGWLAGDRYMNIPHLRNSLKECADRLLPPSAPPPPTKVFKPQASRTRTELPQPRQKKVSPVKSSP